MNVIKHGYLPTRDIATVAVVCLLEVDYTRDKDRRGQRWGPGESASELGGGECPVPRGAQDADRIACREHVHVTRARDYLGDYLGSQREWIGSHAVYGSRAAGSMAERESVARFSSR